MGDGHDVRGCRVHVPSCCGCAPAACPPTHRELVALLAPAGRLPAFNWLPQLSLFGDSWAERIQNMLAIVPVLMTA